jgi:hypothetical protein
VVGQRLAAVQHQVLALDEAHRLHAGEADAVLATDAREPGVDLLGVDPLRRLAFEAQQHRLVAAVPLAGGAEGAEQLGLHPGHLAEQALVAEPGHEQQGRPHRPDGVGRRGADTDLEQIENADCHDYLTE